MIHFVTGMPRSGSTLLMQLLGQHPDHYVSPTSGLIETFLSSTRGWRNNSAYKAEGLDIVKPRLQGVMRGVLEGYYHTTLQKHKFDKNRGWLHHYEDVKWATGHEPVMITTVRDIREVLASFERLYQKRDGAFGYSMDEAYFQQHSVTGRCQQLMNEAGGMVATPTVSVRDALHRNCRNVLIVPYKVLVKEPKTVLDSIHKMTGSPDHEYEFANIKQITHENDEHFGGLNLHVVRPTMEAPPEDRWKKYLNDPVYLEALKGQYPDFHDGSEILPLME